MSGISAVGSRGSISGSSNSSGGVAAQPQFLPQDASASFARSSRSRMSTTSSDVSVSVSNDGPKKIETETETTEMAKSGAGAAGAGGNTMAIEHNSTCCVPASSSSLQLQLAAASVRGCRAQHRDENAAQRDQESAFILSASFRPGEATASTNAARGSSNVGIVDPIIPGGVGGGLGRRARTQQRQQQQLQQQQQRQQQQQPRRRPPAAISFRAPTNCRRDGNMMASSDAGSNNSDCYGHHGIIGGGGGRGAATATASGGSHTRSNVPFRNNGNANIGLGLGGSGGGNGNNNGGSVRLQSRLRLSSSLQRAAAAAASSGRAVVVGGRPIMQAQQRSHSNSTSASGRACRSLRPPPGLTSQPPRTAVSPTAAVPRTVSIATSTGSSTSTSSSSNSNHHVVGSNTNGSTSKIGGGMKMGRNGLGHRTLVVVPPLPLGEGVGGTGPPKTTTPTLTKVATLRLSAQSSLYSPRVVPADTAFGTATTTPTIDRSTATNTGIGIGSRSRSSSSRPSSSASNSSATTATAKTITTTRQLQWFTPIKQEDKGKSSKGNGSSNNKWASTSTSIATPTTVATTPSRSSIMDGGSLLPIGGGATPGGGGCYLSSICSGSDDDATLNGGGGGGDGGAGVIGGGGDSRRYFGSGTTPVPTTVVRGGNGSAGRGSIVSPLAVLSDITNNKVGPADARSNDISNGFITPRKADRDFATKPPTPTIPAPPSKFTSPAASPPPQNLKGDPHRQAKVKTELCLYYLKDQPCPFGERCNYAHGWDELRFKKLRELERNGLIPNASQYRTHPCLSWITTGSCPFGQRCTSIHDPRAAGSTNSWMPFADSPVANLDTNVNVDKFYHRHNGSLHSSNPLVGQVVWEKCRPSTFGAKANGGISKKGCFGVGAVGKPHQQPPIGPRTTNENINRDKNDVWGAKEWSDTYSLVCNHDASRSSPSNSSSPPTYTLMSKTSFATALAAASAGDNNGCNSTGGSTSANVSAGKKIMTEEHRLSIALLMSCGDELPRHDDYIYMPSHLVFGELCMILQTRYFRLGPSDGASKLESDVSNKILGTNLNSVREISIDEYNGSRTPWGNRNRYPYSPQSIIVARKIAFGPVGEANANVSLWFDILASEIAPCTPQMVKRLKRVRSKAQMLNGNKRKDPSSPPFPPLPFHVAVTDPSVTNNLVAESFHSVTYQPFFLTLVANNDPAGMDLVRDILLHRIRTLRGNDPALALSNEDRILRDRYFALKRSMEKWQWPPCAGRGRVDEHTKVPECSAKYCLPDGSSNPLLNQVYGSFLNRASEGYVETEADGSFDMRFGGAHTTFGRPRLATSRLLSEGTCVPKSKWNQPLVRGDFTLLDSGKDGVAPWDLVKDHYLGEGKADIGIRDSSSPSPDTPSPPKRTHALPLGSSGERRASIFTKMQNAA